jgi:hypothetical protein
MGKLVDGVPSLVLAAARGVVIRAEEVGGRMEREALAKVRFAA